MTTLSNHSTLHDVAELAKVSIKTASRVVNEEPTVAAETRERVLSAIKELAYRPNSLARSMRTNRSDTIGLIVPSIRNPFYPSIAKGVEDVARTHGRTVIVTSADRDPGYEREQIALLVDKRVDGIILASPVVGARALVPAIAAGTPVVAMNPNVALPGAHVLRIANRGAAVEMTQYLISLGHEDIGYIDGIISLERSRERLEGYKEALRLAGVRLRPDRVENGAFEYDAGYQAARRLLRLRPRPTAIFAASDLMALGAIAAAHDAALRVPEDVSIAGFDDIDLASVVRPSLTTVHQPNYEMGRMAAEIILNPDERRRGLVREMQTRVVVRQSTAPPNSHGSQEPAKRQRNRIAQ